MKDEVFDELLKRKVDADDHPFSPSDVNRVLQYVRHNLPLTKPTKWYQKFNGKKMLGSSFVAISALMIFQMVKNHQLENQFKQFDQKLNQTQLQLMDLQKKQSVLEHHNQQLIAQNSELNTKLEATEFHPVGSLGSVVNVPQNLKKSQNNSTLLFAKNTENGTFEKGTFSTDINEKVAIATNVASGAEQIEKLDTQVGKVKTKNDQLAFAAKPTKDTMSVKDSLAEVKKMLKKFNYSVGFAGNIGTEERGFGLVTNIIQNNKWQFQSGIRINYFDGKYFEDEEDYWRSEKTSFEADYNLKNTFLHIRDFHNIQFKYSVIQIPLSVSYLMPLKKDVSFIIGAGTKLLLRTNEFVSYYAKIEPGNTVFNNSFDMVKTNLPKFNDVIVSLGIQKNWKRFSFQGLMYIDKSMKDIKFRQMPMSAGFSMHLLYNFRK